jgi:flagellin-like hook-associated protein FlgL
MLRSPESQSDEIKDWCNDKQAGTFIQQSVKQLSNTQSAESLIRDADFAYETAAFSKNQILTQSSTSMLAQSNMVPQSVLQLLG